MIRSFRIRPTWLLGLALVLTGPPARGDLSWTVSLDTSPLAANSPYAGPFALDFELSGNNGNTVTLSNFSFGGGMAGLGPAYTNVGASGDLGGSVVLDDTMNFLVNFNQQFSAGGTLTFTVDSTAIAPSSGRDPDAFTMVIFYGYDPGTGYEPLGTMGPPSVPTADLMNSTFLSVDINGPGATTPVAYAGGTNGEISIIVTPSSVPELSSGAMMLFGLLSMAGALSWRVMSVR